MVRGVAFWVAVAGFLGFVAAGGGAARAADAATGPCVDLSGEYKGRICGRHDAASGTDSYLGIEFATAALWDLPVGTTDYGNDPVQATRFGQKCLQPGATGIDGGIDCLNLNIYAPANAKDAPVMIFIYGGAFVTGSNRDNTMAGAKDATMYDGSAFAERHGVVVAVLNYRVGVPGFLPVLKNKAGGFDVVPSNLGLRDQRLGMRWVRDNIAAFGGDPDRITVFGESAGAMSVGIHVLAHAKPAFIRAAIMESNLLGYAYPDLPAHQPNAAQANATPDPKPSTLQQIVSIYWGCLKAAVAQKTDCDPPTETPPDTFTLDQVGIAQSMYMEDFGARFIQLSETIEMMAVTPVVDRALARGNPHGLESVLPVQPALGLRRGAPVPLLFGFNGNEGLLFVQSLTSIVPPVVTDKLYVSGVEGVFPHHAEKILATPRYSTRTISRYGFGSLKGGENPDARPETALTDMVTDLAFECAALSANADGGSPHGVWIYHFLQPPPVVMAPGISLCNPDNHWNNSCHASELTFVFDTLKQAGASMAPDDVATARLLNGAWADFAKHHATTGPGDDFVRWSPQHPLVNRIRDGKVDAVSGLEMRRANFCGEIWDGLLPGGVHR